MELRISNSAATAAEFTDERGSTWYGLACHFEGQNLVIDGGGEIQSAARAWLEVGNQPAPYAEPTPTEDDYAAAIQTFIDQTARDRRYADGISLASYAGSSYAPWAAEASAFIAWRDAVWLYAYGELAKVEAGQRARPSVPALISELPTASWPG